LDSNRRDGAIAGSGETGSGGATNFPGSGGNASGGGAGSGGQATGGTATGGTSSGGQGTGGFASGGGTTTNNDAGSGGQGAGGNASGGRTAPEDGGTAKGGSSGGTGTGGAATGGAATGGTTARGGSSGMGGSASGGSSGTGGATGAAKPTIWIAGDSTVMTYAANNTDGTNGVSIEGWGQEIGQYFNTNVTISNQAIGGRSVAFFMWSVTTDSSGAYQCDSNGAPIFKLDASGNHLDNAQWSRIKSGIKAGDFLMIQFGTNDETHTCPRYVSLADFKSDLGFMADTVRAKGATPIFVTPMGHRSFSGTTATNTLLPYANAMKDEATAKTIEVEDLNLRSVEYYQSVGSSYLATNIFDGGTTHFIKAGAVKMAQLIVGEVRKNDGPLAAYLK
jgi:hypothetical protein